MENSESAFKLALKPGLIISAISVAISLILWVLIEDLQVQQKFGYATWLILAFLYHYYTKEYRENSLGGNLSYGQAFSFMFFISLIGAAVTVIYTFVLFSYLDPTMIDVMKEQAAEKLYEQGLEGDQIDQAMKIQEMFMAPGILSLFAFFGSLFFGTILSLVVAIFVKKEVQIFED